MHGVGLVVGRFQPPHPGHQAIIREALSLYETVVVAVIRGPKTGYNYIDNPLFYPHQIVLFHKLLGDDVKRITFKCFESADLKVISEDLREHMNVTGIFCGTDRKEAYEQQIKTYKLPCELHLLDRNLTARGISSSEIRSILRDGDGKKKIKGLRVGHIDWMESLSSQSVLFRDPERQVSFKEDVNLRNGLLKKGIIYTTVGVYRGSNGSFSGIMIRDHGTCIPVPKSHLDKIKFLN